MSLLSPYYTNPLMTLAQGNQTAIGAPGVAPQAPNYSGLGGFLSNPLLGMAAGLLTPTPNRSFGGGLTMGLQNMMAMQRQQQATALMGARLQEMRTKRQREERQRENLESLAQQLDKTDPGAGAWIRAGMTPPTPQKAQLFLAGVEGQPGQRQQMMMVDGQAVPVPGAAPYTPTPQTVIDMGAGSIPTGTQRVADPDSPTGTRIVAEPGSPQFTKQQAEIDSLNEGLANIRAQRQSLQEFGTETFGEEKSRQALRYGQTLSTIAKLRDLGVLQPGEIEMMQGQLTDPTGPRGLLPGASKRIDAQLDEIEDMLQLKLENATKRLSGEATMEPTEPQPQGSNRRRRWNPATGRLE